MKVVFAGFSAESLAQRVLDCKPKVIITCNAVRRGPKVLRLKPIVDEALLNSLAHGVSVGKVILMLTQFLIQWGVVHDSLMFMGSTSNFYISLVASVLYANLFPCLGRCLFDLCK